MKNGLAKTNCLFLICSLFFGVFLSWSVFTSRPAQAATGINKTINFQGRLLNNQGAVVPDGFYNIEFKIYQDGDGQTAGNTTGTPAGTLKWTEDYLNQASKGVKVVNGFMSVQLGSVNPFGTSVDWNQDTLWLSMNIAGTGASCTPFASCSPDGEMVPMQPMTAAPYALNAGQLNGLASSNFVQIAQGVQADASTSSSVFLNKTGTSGNIIQLQKGGVDVLTVGNTGTLLMEPSADSTTALQVSNRANGYSVFTVDTSGNQVVLGKTNSLNGKLAFATTSGGLLNIIPTSNGSSFNLTLPAETGTICTTAVGGACSSVYATTTGTVLLGPASVQADGSNNNSIFINKTTATGNIFELQKSASDVFKVDNTGNITSTGQNTLSRNGSGSNDYVLGLTGTPSASSTSSILRLGSALSGGNGAANGGTYLSIVEPSSGTGSAADFVNFQNGTTVELQLTAGGNLTVGGTYNTNTFNSNTLGFGGNSAVTINSSGSNNITLDSGSSGGTVALGNNGATTNIGTSNAAHTINIGTGGGGTTTQAVTIGAATNSSSTLTLQGGNGSAAILLTAGNNGSGVAGGIQIGNTSGANQQTVAIGTNNSGTNIVNIGTGTSQDSVTIGDSTTAASSVSLKAGSTGGISLGANTTLTANSNLTYASGTGKFDASAGSGTFDTTTGTNHLNGATTVTGTNTFTVNGGATVLNGASAGSGTAAKVNTNSASNIGLVVQGASSQTAALLQLQDSGGTALLGVAANGDIESTGNFNNPYGGIGNYGNLLVQSEQLGTSWTASNVSVTQNDGASNPAPDGNTTADKLVSSVSGTHTLTQTYSSAGNNTYTFSIWLKTATPPQPVQLRIDSDGTPASGTAASFTLTGGWQRYSVTQTFTSGVTAVTPTLVITNNSTSVVGWGAQLIQSASAGVYARTASSIVPAGSGIFDNQSAIFQASTNSVTAYQFQNASGVNVAAIDTSGGQLVLGSGSVSGQVKFNYGGQTGSVTLQVANPSSTGYTITLPAENGQICTTAASAACTAVYAPAGGGYVNFAPSSAQADASNNNTVFINKTSATGNIFELQKSASDVFKVDNAGNVTSTGQNTLSRTGSGANDYTLGLTSTPSASSSSSLLRLGGALTGGNGVANGGTYFSIVQPASGAGSSADFVNFQNGSTVEMQVTSGGNLTVNGTYNTNTFNSTSLQFGGASGSVSSSAGNLTVQAAGTNSLLLNTVGAGTVGIATANTTTVNIATNDIAHAIHIGDGGASTTQTITIGSNGANGSSIALYAGSGASITLNGATVISGSNTFATGSGNVSLNGDTTVASGKNFTQSGTGNFSTGSGTNTLNGNTSVASGKSFTANGTALFKNSADSTSAYQFQNQNSRNLLSVDTSNSNIIVGNDTDGANLTLGALGNVSSAIRKTMGVTGTVAANDLVQVDTANDGKVKQAVASSSLVFGIATTAATNANEDIVIDGVYQVSADATALAPGDLLVSSSTAGKVTKAGSTVASGTVLGRAMSTKSAGAGLVWARLTLGVGGSDSLQTAYNNSVGSTTPEIKVDSTRGGVDIQDADSTIGGSLLTVRQGSGVLGTAILDVQSNGTIATGQTALTLFNTTATTLNAFQAATAVTVGATSGTFTIQNPNFTVGASAGGGVFTNNGATLNTTLALGDLAAGSIGSAGLTVDVYTSFSIAPTASNRTYTLPTPTASTLYGRTIYISNIASAGNYFIISGIRIPPGSTGTLVWSNTSGGASWQFAGAGGASIENQNSAAQTAVFWINGSGRSDTSFLTPLLDTPSGTTTLEIGTNNATTISIKQNTTIATGKLLTLANTATIGGACSNGAVYYDSTANRFKGCENSVWITIDSYVDVQSFSSNGTWTKQSNVSVVEVYLVGAGGGGGAGAARTPNTEKDGGAGGGGGAMFTRTYLASDLPSTASVTIGTGGGGGAAANGASGGNGSAGGATCFSQNASCAGTIYGQAFGGGGGGGGGSVTGGGGGGGGGAGSAGSSGVNTSNAGAAGGGPGGAAGNASATGGAGAGGGNAGSTSGVAGTAGPGAEYGGGGGGGAAGGSSAPGAGGSSLHGAGGGGAGASTSGGNNSSTSGAAGGSTGTITAGGGGSGSTSTACSASGTAGSNGNSSFGSFLVLGPGGGGGGANGQGGGQGNGCNGGNGGQPGGGAGGGGAGSGNSNAGGNGGTGGAGGAWLLSW